MKTRLFALAILCLTGLVGCTTAPITGPEGQPESSADWVTTFGSVGSSYLGDPTTGSGEGSNPDGPDFEVPEEVGEIIGALLSAIGQASL